MRRFCLNRSCRWRPGWLPGGRPGLGLAPSVLSFAFCALALWCVPAALEGMAADRHKRQLLKTACYRFAANTLLAGTAVCGFLAWGRRQLRKGGRR